MVRTIAFTEAVTMSVMVVAPTFYVLRDREVLSIMVDAAVLDEALQDFDHQERILAIEPGGVGSIVDLQTQLDIDRGAGRGRAGRHAVEAQRRAALDTEVVVERW